MQITFQKVGDLEVACVIVARGEALAYLLGGAIYRRHGSSDVQAQPEDLDQLVAEYALCWEDSFKPAHTLPRMRSVVSEPQAA